MMHRASAALAGLVLLACSATGPRDIERLSLSFATQSAAITVGSDVLEITKAEVILREVELEAAETEACDEADDVVAASQGPGGTSQDFDHDDDAEADLEEADCEEFEAGPFRLELPLNSITTLVTVNVPAGTYEEVEFEIHKVKGNDPATAAFLAANPDFVGKSIRIEGTFNGQPFVFESDVEIEQELDLVPPLVVDGTAPTNITIQIDLGTWFLAAGGALINPATANHGGPNEHLVKLNLLRSFHGFEDEDCDGHDDH